ncbi:MAG: hypothetical protein R2709_10880 [Marmoricola sp.]
MPYFFWSSLTLGCNKAMLREAADLLDEQGDQQGPDHHSQADDGQDP